VLFDSQAARKFCNGFVLPLEFGGIPFKINPVPITFIKYQCPSGCMESAFPMFEHILYLRNELCGWCIVGATVDQIGIIDVSITRKVVVFLNEEIG
jgi:hypothetical protein